MTRRHHSAFVAFSLALVFALTSCGPAQPSGSAPSGSAPAATAPAASAPASGAAPTAAAPASAPAASGAPAAKPAAGQPAAASGRDTLNVVVGALPRSGDTFLENSLGASPEFRAVYDVLVENVQGKPTGRLAESWSQPNPTTWEFKLRKGVKFQNGEDFNADAVKFNVEYIMNPENKSVRRPATTSFERVEVVDPSTVRIITKAPDGSVLSNMATVPIQPPNYFKQKGAADYARAPIGTGPYRVAEWKQDESITLEAWPDSWRGAPKLKRMVFRQMPEEAARVAALQSGQVDIAYNVEPQEVQGLKDRGFQIQSVPVAQALVLYLRNNVESPLKDVRVRQAISYAIDVDGLAKGLLGEFAPPPNGQIAVPQSFGYVQGLKPYPYDPNKAKQLLADAGYPNGFTVTFDTPNGRYQKDKEAAEAVAAQLGRVGIKVNINVMESGLYLGNLFAAKMNPLFTIGLFSAPAYDASTTFSVLVKDASPIAADSDPHMDELWAKQRGSLDQNERAKVIEEMTRYSNEQAFNVVLFQLPGIYALSPKVKGVQIDADYSFKDLMNITVEN